MQNYLVELESEANNSFRCQKAANSLDIDVEKKLKHRLEIRADVTSKFNVGLIVGNSGSGKTTLAKQIFGPDCFKEYLNPNEPVINQFPESYSYDDCANALSGVGLTSVPCWIRPAKTLSNGQKARAEAALSMSFGEHKVIDEWTSVVDRTVAKVMSHCVAKNARKTDKQIVLLSCHYDVVEWLQPDWIIDCNKQEFINLRGSLRPRSEQLQFEIKEIDSKSWRFFSKYHYLNENLPGGKNYYYGLFYNGEQIGFQAYSNYVPHRKGTKMIMHFNRTVIHPDFAGFGLGIKMINETAALLSKKRPDIRIMGKFSSIPVYKSMIKSPKWILKEADTKIQIVVGGNMMRKTSFRKKVKTFSFEYIGGK